MRPIRRRSRKESHATHFVQPNRQPHEIEHQVEDFRGREIDFTVGIGQMSKLFVDG